MRIPPRRLLSLPVVLLGSGALLLGGPLAPAALARDGSVPSVAPLTQPGSVIGSYDAVSAAERARAVGNSIPTGPLGTQAPPRVVIPGSVVAGTAMTAVTGLEVGWKIGGLINGGACAAGLHLFCKPPGYQINSDVSSGATATPFDFSGHSYFGEVGTVEVTRVDPLAPHESTVLVNVSASQRGYASPALGWRCVDGYELQTGGVSGYFPADWAGGKQATLGATAGCVDHLGLLDMWVDATDNTAGHTRFPAAPAAQTSPDPLRLWQTTYRCTLLDGSSPSTVVLPSEQFRESDAAWPLVPQATCDGGDVLDYVKIERIVPDGSAPDTVVSEWTRNQATKDWQSAYPSCGDGHCKLLLFRVDGATRLSCFANPAACTSWFEDPAKADRYQCTYAGAEVALSECNAYRAVFDPARATRAKRAPAVGSEPNTADPLTGALPDPSADTGSLPDGDTQSDPGCPPDFNILSVLNPFWYYSTSVCAARALFEPSPGALQTAHASASAGWAGTGVPAWGDALGGVGTTLAGIGASAGGCAGPHFSITLAHHGYDFDPLDACSQPMQGVALVVKLFASIAVLVAGARFCARPVLAAIGMRQ
ncbi:MAG: hypothetical protein QOI54_1829 [Actinomycetota bacterium]|nr:hypothetical protein [Actinomycetota bacterium]